MADQADVLKRLEERAAAAIKRITDGHGCLRVPADPTDPDLVISDLIRLARALLESQGELLERAGNEECNCEVEKGKTAWECPRCGVLARAEKVRKGEV